MRAARLTLAICISLAASHPLLADPHPGQMRSGTVQMDGTGGNTTAVLFTVPDGWNFINWSGYVVPEARNLD